MKQRRALRCASIVTILALTAATDAALACEVCYGNADSPWIDASRMAVLMMLGVVGAVQVGFIWFFLYLRRRVRMAGEAAQHIQLVKG